MVEGGVPLPHVTRIWLAAVGLAVPIAGLPGGAQSGSVIFAVQTSSLPALRRSVQEGNRTPALPDRPL
jgi:hypothetical protein